ncbi:hypothetical protein MA16_Dca002006 [Dendrobium catenatum]|uniref:WIYLD domain-containing protein n=1 Tax=Dendrobium catenatum TaxID=906689 RepID=A0A2I0XE41_9ASPA|nr:hypothetical protein MA16_Dca002006 [Dendrobium catenatum]
MDAAIAALTPLGFEKTRIRKTVNMLVKAYNDPESGWFFVEEDYYRLPIETMIKDEDEEQQRSNVVNEEQEKENEEQFSWGVKLPQINPGSKHMAYAGAGCWASAHGPGAVAHGSARLAWACSEDRADTGMDGGLAGLPRMAGFRPEGHGDFFNRIIIILGLGTDINVGKSKSVKSFHHKSFRQKNFRRRFRRKNFGKLASFLLTYSDIFSTGSSDGNGTPKIPADNPLP